MRRVCNELAYREKRDATVFGFDEDYLVSVAAMKYKTSPWCSPTARPPSSSSRLAHNPPSFFFSPRSSRPDLCFRDL